MRTITAKAIEDAVVGLCLRANLSLRADVLAALKAAYARETGRRGRGILEAIIANARAAKSGGLAICQDTGMPVVLVETGAGACVSGDIRAAVNAGVARGYRAGHLRNSIVKDPLARGTPGYGPAVLHLESIPGKKIRITVLPKGFGCENKSQLKMFAPTVSWVRIKEFIVAAVKVAGPDACPPYVVGVGIGGTADYASWLAKKALLRKVGVVGPVLRTGRSGIGPYSVSVPARVRKELENELLREINGLNIGPMGLGGKTTALAVHVETYPTHIAGLPVAVNISCHALRSAAAVL